MALAVLAAGGLRAALPSQLRDGDARWAFIVVLVVLLAILDHRRSGAHRPGFHLAPRDDRIADRPDLRRERRRRGAPGGRDHRRGQVQHRRQRPAGQRRRHLAQQRDRLRPVVLGSRSRRRGRPRARIGPPARLRLSRDGQPRVRGARLVSEVPGLPQSLVHDRDGVQPDGRLGHQALGQAHDDGRGGDLAASRDPRRLQGRQHPQVSRRRLAGAAPAGPGPGTR